MGIIKRLVVVITIISLAVLNSGCLVTMNNVKKYNARVRERAIILEVVGDDEDATARLGIDLLQAKDLATGYAAAWRNSPGSMTWSAVLDTLWMGLTAYGSKELYDYATEDDDSSSEKEPSSNSNGRDTVTVTTDGRDTVTVTTDGSTTIITVETL